MMNAWDGLNEHGIQINPASTDPEGARWDLRRCESPALNGWLYILAFVWKTASGERIYIARRETFTKIDLHYPREFEQLLMSMREECLAAYRRAEGDWDGNARLFL